MSDDKNNTSSAPAGDLQFVLGSDPVEFTWTVRVPVPAADDYRFAKLPLNFIAVDQDALDRMQGRGLKKGEVPPTDMEICQGVVCGWPSMKNKAGEEVPFSAQSLAGLLKAPMVRAAIVATYLAAMSGMAARKNA